jgi:hypothetical protein
LLRALSGARGRWRQLHAGTARLRQANGNRLFGRSRTVLAFTDMVDLFAHELAGLCRRRFPGTLRLTRAFNSGFFWHSVTSDITIGFATAMPF